jgi:phosphoribosyl 1,2-cyclic phosphodiesterase
MEVTIYGVRGSIPTPGAETLRYGGNTVCVGVRLSDGTRLFLDAGTGLRLLGRELLALGYRAPIHFLLSHQHYDHVIGLPFFLPVYVPQTTLHVHPLRRGGMDGLAAAGQIFDGIQTPVALASLPAKIVEEVHETEPWVIGSAQVRRIDLNHPGGAQGFRIEDADGGSLCYLTDNELEPPGAVETTPAQQAQFARRCGLLIQDAQYLPADLPMKRGWGHSTVPQVLAMNLLAEPECHLLFHHDPERTDPMLDLIGEQAEDFARQHAARGSIVVAAEGMRFDVTGAGVRRFDGLTLGRGAAGA